ncbi:hypothetical protein A3194_12340 [Candidatus Thiodiazotropha endoloripes]|nr:hypothetical protein A3194_12340 [Candidatus Thiodiazotropha endoloripes]
MDRRRLQFLVEKVGQVKIRRSAAKYSNKHPGSKIFVSRLLKYYQTKVPTHIYAPVKVPIYHLYVLVHLETNTQKIGVSGDWAMTRRIALLGNAEHEEFDLYKSLGFDYHDKKITYRIEKDLKKTFKRYRVIRPNFVPYGAAGHSEWFSYDAYQKIVDFITQNNGLFNQCNGKMVTLREALNHNSKLKLPAVNPQSQKAS